MQTSVDKQVANLPAKSEESAGHRVFPEERRRQIRLLVAEEGRVSVDDLTLRFDVSKVTIRNDLDRLEREGVLKRTHGGAIAVSTDDGRADLDFFEREQHQLEEKKRIGVAGAELVEDGMTILIDASTTALQVARGVQDRLNLTVVTNCPPVAMEFTNAPGVTVVMLGGIVRPSSWSIIGPWIGQLLPQVNIELAFVSCKGVTVSHGLTDVNAFIVEAKRAFVRAARRTIVVADHQKWGRMAFASFATLRDIDMIITGVDAPSAEVEAAQAVGVKVRMV